VDFIQQAIDKAREQREAPGAQPWPPRQSTPQSSQVNAQTNTQKIEYTQTRVVTLNTEQLRRERIIAAADDDKRADSYRQLRTQILRMFRENNWHTLAITSPNSQAGKTLTALNLAISLSLEVNQTVMLVELDLRNPSILNKLGVECEYGLIDVVEGKVELSQALVNPGFERLVILPNCGTVKHRSELLSSPQMGAILKDIVHRYESRLIIFDLPALLDDDDALVFAPYADATLLVVEDCVSKRADIERSLQLLKGTRLLGTVLNKVR
jgi:protein-tyrosine kinase